MQLYLLTAGAGSAERHFHSFKRFALHVPDAHQTGHVILVDFSQIGHSQWHPWREQYQLSISTTFLRRYTKMCQKSYLTFVFRIVEYMVNSLVNLNFLPPQTVRYFHNKNIYRVFLLRVQNQICWNPIFCILWYPCLVLTGFITSSSSNTYLIQMANNITAKQALLTAKRALLKSILRRRGKRNNFSSNYAGFVSYFREGGRG